MPHLSVMIKPASADCNLNCDYCFYRDEASTRRVFSAGRMDIATAKLLLVRAYDYARGCSVHFTFQGGEPLLAGCDFFRVFFDTAIKTKPDDVSVSFSVQTNGTLLSDEYCRLFRRFGVLLGLSLDGTPGANLHRPDRNGKNSFARVLRGAELLKKHNVEFNILTVVTKRTTERVAEIYRFFVSRGFRHLQFIPCLPPIDRTESRGSASSSLYPKKDFEPTPQKSLNDSLQNLPQKSLEDLLQNFPKNDRNDPRFHHDFTINQPVNYAPTNREFARFLKQLFDLYERDFLSNNYVSERRFDNYIALLAGRRAEQCGFNGACSEQFVVEADGSVYPCDFYCTDRFLLGNILKNDFFNLKNDIQTTFLSDRSPQKPQCATCRHLFLCRSGGCKRAASVDYCEAYAEFFDYAADRLKKLAEIAYKN